MSVADVRYDRVARSARVRRAVGVALQAAGVRQLIAETVGMTSASYAWADADVKRAGAELRRIVGMVCQ